MLIDLAGAFLLTISFPDLSPNPRFNPFGPVEFSTYQDCLSAAETLTTWMHNPRGGTHVIVCVSKTTGQVHATWGRGPLQ